MLTIIIPTKNRPDFLMRLLSYYRNVGYKYRICIGDGSELHYLAWTKKMVEEFGKNLNITYQEYPGLIGPVCIKEMLKTVTTPYVAYIGDDDFLIPSGLDEAVSFMERHPDYSAAHGTAALFALESSGPYGKLRGVARYPQREISGRTASDRLLRFLGGSYMVTLFSVHRTEVFRNMYKDAQPYHDITFSGETLPCCISVVRGNIKHLDCLYMVRQGNGPRYILPRAYEWLTGPKWFDSYRVFHDSLVEALIEEDGITGEKAHEVVKQAFWSYMSALLNHSLRRYYPKRANHTDSKVKRMFKRIPYLHAIVRKVKTMTASRRDISQEVLLSPTSPYHKDFMPIYELLTGSKNVG